VPCRGVEGRLNGESHRVGRPEWTGELDVGLAPALRQGLDEAEARGESVIALMDANQVLALFTEIYGFPLTLHLLSGRLRSRYPELDLFSHDAGHLLQTLLGWKGDPHVNPMHLLSNGLIFGGFIPLASASSVYSLPL
jgi:hypothetical protein